MPSPSRPNRLRRIIAIAVAFGWLAYMHFGVDFSFIPPEPASSSSP